jgi:NhaA family Na+:H+ antiporter
MAHRSHLRVPVVGRALSPRGSDYVAVETLGGVLLLAAACTALVWANVSGTSYTDVWSERLTVGWGNFAITEDWLHWINDGVMTVFFFVVGLEIKRELVHGELRDRRAAGLPFLAALGGMLVPPLLYLALNAGGAGARGWAIPMATDIAFAVVILAALGHRVPRPLKVFLLTLAIIDDIGAVVVIAVFYSEGIAPGWALGAIAVVGAILCMQRLRVATPLAYVAPALILWVCTFESGVHATIAGVVLGLLTPARPFGGRDVIDALEQRLHLWSSFLVVPLFALANSGIGLGGEAVEQTLRSPIALGIVIGLVLGKPLGIVAASALAIRVGLGRLGDGVSLRHVVPLGCVAGIGFTMSLFISELTFRGEQLSEAKIGILVASTLSAVIGIVALLVVARGGRRGGTPSDVHALGAASWAAVPPPPLGTGATEDLRDAITTAIGRLRRHLMWERLLLAVLGTAALLTIGAGVQSGNATWYLSTLPLATAAWLTALVVRRSSKTVDELVFTSEMYLGSHSPFRGDRYDGGDNQSE